MSLDPNKTSFEVEKLTTLGELSRIRSEWTQLWTKSASATPFQSAEWLLAWARHLWSSDIWALAVRCEGRLVGLAPMCVYQDTEARRYLLLLGTGISDYLDILAEPGFETTVAALVFNHLTEHSERWDSFDFQQLRPESPLLHADVGPAQESRVELQEYCPALQIDGRAGANIPKNFQQKLEYERRRLERAASPRFVSADESNFEPLFTTFQRLHRARWNQRGTDGMLQDESIRRFHEDAASALLTRGVLRLYAVYAQQRPIACCYGFLYRRRAYLYLSGFDPEFGKLSVGNQVIWHAIQQAEREGATCFDFLRGQEPYKYRWGAEDQPTFRRKLRV